VDDGIHARYAGLTLKLGVAIRPARESTPGLPRRKVMRNARKALLLAAAALAVMAFAASSVSAQTLTINNETNGGACGAAPTKNASTHAVSGGCFIHANGEGNIELRKHVFGIEDHITSCTNEFSGHVGTAGTGFITNQVLGGAACTRKPCEEVNGVGATVKSPWPATGAEGTSQEPQGGESAFLQTTFCVQPLAAGSSPESCTIKVPFGETATNHRYEFGHAAEMPGADGFPGFRCELVGHWNGEADLAAGEVNVEVIHNS
jgi:hypothetical protein